MLTFAAAVFFLLITPGPGVLSTAGVGASFGASAGMRYVSGLFLGTNLVALAVVSGLAAAVLAVPAVRTVLMIGSTLFLLYIAAKIALSGSKIAFIHPERAPGIAGGLGLQAINPKAYAVNTAFFSGFAFYPDSLMLETLLKFMLINAIWIPVHIAWLYAGVFLHRLDLSARVHSIINAVMALAMLCVVVLAAFSGFTG
ncbi:threonine/homoserine/homoserine lactone efflux protein [Roseibium hamelinense]|uniref:Threonine/homoserine/homoserine lactone efflux protein n=1 Tax=Roseibium hamelinense TaxID=150831 RepID=A0A562TBQ8_9HYPH|nr:LysE family transporter [Roseibium hamelinense]MTI45333.1 LysE family translocator [Roseibium hamelinense]TWI90300.1 threonine/homoserine/homoserine lactone efflux protein [Roseibium hamelinense]